MTTVADIRAIVEEAYPPHLAESWDKVGLICGDPADQVHKVVFALDCTQEVAERAVEARDANISLRDEVKMRVWNSMSALRKSGELPMPLRPRSQIRVESSTSRVRSSGLALLAAARAAMGSTAMRSCVSEWS